MSINRWRAAKWTGYAAIGSLVLKADMLDPQFECVMAQEQSSFRCERLSCAAFEVEHPWHFHPAFELTWIIRSGGTRYVGDSVERYEPGDLVLVGPNLPHCWRNDAVDCGAERPEWIIAQFDPSCFGAGFLTLPEAASIRSLLDKAQFGVAFDQDVAAESGLLFRNIVQRTGMSRLTGLIDLLDSLGRQPHAILADPGYYQSNHVDQVLVDRLNRAQLFIQENLTEEVSQSALADELGLSASAFSKVFRAATGRTFTSMVKLMRINEACRLLANGSDRITAVALNSGYQHTSHFDQHFRELKGMSPSEYRRRAQALGKSPQVPSTSPISAENLR